MFTVTISSSLYLYLVFKNDFKYKPDLKELAKVKPIEHIENKKEMIVSLIILLVVIILIVFKELIA
jgi:accessory gene regulator protein AgrB